MKTIDYDYSYDFKKTFFKKKPAADERIKFIYIKPKLMNNITEDSIYSLVGLGAVFINFPFKSEGWLNGIVFKNQYYYLDSYGKVQIDARNGNYPSERELLRKEWYKKGVSLDGASILCHVSPLKTIARSCEGKIIKIYNDKKGFYVPFELTSLNSQTSQSDFIQILKDFENFSARFNKVATEFEYSKPCIILSKINFGNIAYVNGTTDKNAASYAKFNAENYDKHYDSNSNYDLQGKDWNVDINILYHGPLVNVSVRTSSQTSQVNDANFAKNIIRKTTETYSSIEDISKETGISIWALHLITSSLFVVNCTTTDDIDDDSRISDLEHWNIGLSMRSKMKHQRLVLPGYTRFCNIYGGNEEYQTNGYYEFSSRAVQLIKEYKEKFPFIFDSLDKFRDLYNRQNKFFKVRKKFKF